MKFSLAFKSIFQTIKISLESGFFNLFRRDINYQYSLIQNKLISKNLIWNRHHETKVFAIFSINNWESDLLESLETIGKVCHFTWTNVADFFKNKNQWQNFYLELNKQLQKTFDSFYDENVNIVVFIYASDFCISPESLKYLSKKNVVLVSFCWDDILYFKNSVRGQPVGVSKLSQLADINLTLSPSAIGRYNYHHSAAIFWDSLPCPVDPKLNLVSKDSINSEFYLLFVGSKYGWRELFIQKLISAGINVKCFGDGWKNGRLSNEDLRREVIKAPLTLGFSNVGYTKRITTVKGRDFEIPLWGGLYLTQNSRGLEHYYTFGKEILVYDVFFDCLKTINYIKNNKDIAYNIRVSGQKRAQLYSSWASRMLYLQKLINENVKNFNG